MTLTQIRQRKGIILDTNLLLLYFVGRHDPAMIGKYTERLSRYNADDFVVLARWVATFKQLTVTPNVLTEVINLIDKRSGRFSRLLHQIGIEIEVLDEVYIPSAAVLTGQKPQFQAFGLTDLGLYALAKTDFVIFTDDQPLLLFIAGQGYAAINFDQLRDFQIEKGPPHYNKGR